ncbi:MAG: hypothetical protein KF830_03870 [Planctomycetes bacterium]|nr:hypothetical protein [Planctomycetota bacterium]
MPHRLLLAATLAAPLAAQTLAFAEGAPTALTIVAVAENAPNAGDTVLLQDVELLDLELTGRTLAQEHDPGRTRRLVLQGIARAELPGGARLFRYRRGGGAFWGFLHVAADGTPRVVLEAAGAGPGSVGDPFLDRIGVAADGGHAAIAPAAGGLHVVRLDGGVFASTGRADRLALPTTERVVATSVLVGAAFVFFQTSPPARVWRCAVADGGAPVDVSPPPAPNAILKDQMALSRDGTTLVFLHGPQQQQRLWLLRTTGGPSLLPPPPGKYEEAGYLPEDPGEPAMLLADDGSRLFLIESGVRDELYLLDTSGLLPPLAMTEDAVFEPYIGSHILPRFAGDRLLVAIGDPGQMDWFQARLAPTGGTVTNLTGTGAVTAPFPSGTIDPVQALDGGGFLLVSELQGTSLALRRIDPASGAQTVVRQGVAAAPRAGVALQGAADVVVPATSGATLLRGATGLVLGTLPPDLHLTPPVQGPDFAASWLHLASGFGVGAYYLPDGTLAFGQVDFQLQQIVLTAGGGAVEVGNPVRYLAPATYVVLNRPPVPLRICLSGAGN